MKSTARITLYLLAGFLLFLGYGYSASSLQTLSRSDVLEFGPVPGPSVIPGVYDNFNPNRIPELRSRGRNAPEEFNTRRYAFDPADVGNNLGSHRQVFVPASHVKPPEVSESLPLVNNTRPQEINVNEDEDDRKFVSDFHTDTTIYGNYVGDNRGLSSKDRGFFYEQNLRYDLFTTHRDDDSLALTVDTTHSNDLREYRDGFALNQLTLESRTPNSLLAFGHSYPEFSRFTMTQQMMGFYGTQRLNSFKWKTFAGYKAMEKDDLKNPRWVSGFRMEHQNDESMTLGVSGVFTKDVSNNPGSTFDRPTLRNQVVAFDADLKPTDNIYLQAETARSKTEFDLRTPLGDQSDSAYRALTGYKRENYRLEVGVEEGNTTFFTALGEGPRDERAYFGNLYYDLNRYVSARFSGRNARDNLQGFKVATLVKSQPEFELTLRPSDYYKDLRVNFFYQPTHEYSSNITFVDRYRDLIWLELSQRAGALNYFAGLSANIDKDKITPANDRDINRLDLKLTWEYDAFRQLYGLCSLEQLNYKTAGGLDRTNIYGLGGRSQFHEDIFMALEFIHEINDVKTLLGDSSHDRLNLSLTKEYNNQARVILELEGSNNAFESSNRNFSDLATRLRLLKSF